VKLAGDSPAWRAFWRNPSALTGLALVALVVLTALFADVIAPYPSHAGPVGDFAAMSAGPSAQYLLGTDTIGRDLLTRLIFAYRLSLEMAIVVLAIATPIGVVIGLLGGYLGPAWSYALMRLTDVFFGHSSAGARHVDHRVLGAECDPRNDGHHHDVVAVVRAARL